jgi:hypothetical protein
MDHDIRTRNARSTKELPIARRLDEVVFKEVEVRLDLRVDEGAVDFRCDAVGDWLKEEGDGCIFDTFVFGWAIDDGS